MTRAPREPKPVAHGQTCPCPACNTIRFNIAQGRWWAALAYGVRRGVVDNTRNLSVPATLRANGFEVPDAR